MNFEPSDDQVLLRDGLRSLCRGRFTSERVRKGFDGGVFDELADTGLFSLRADGFGWADAAIAFEELGRALVPGPLVWSHLANGLLDGIVTGVERPAPGESLAVGGVMIEHLTKSDVVAMVGNEGVTVVGTDALGSAVALDWPLDPLTPVHRVDALPAGDVVAGADVSAEWRQGGAVLTAAYEVGMAAACTEAATAYSLERYQFDRPVGSFQAVKHLLADMAVRAEVARAAVHAAAVTLDDPSVGDVTRAVSGARMLAGEAAVANAKGSMQVHGGMGFTWEIDVHLYLKRAWLLNTTFGSPAAHADTLAALLT